MVTSPNNHSNDGDASPTATTASQMAEIAAIARDKIQASAKIMLKNLEELMAASPTPKSSSFSKNNITDSSNHLDATNHTTSSMSAQAQLESAVRTLFSSCTGVGTGSGNGNGGFFNSTNFVDDEVNSLYSWEMSAHSPESSSHRQRTVRQEPSPLRTTENSRLLPSRQRSTERLANLLEQKHRKSEFPSELIGARNDSDRGRCRISVPNWKHQRDFGEHIYEQLFYDDHDHNAWTKDFGESKLLTDNHKGSFRFGATNTTA
jgi:hypothetical protein